MYRRLLLVLGAMGPAALAAQEAGGFTILRDRDTVAVEQYRLEAGELTGSLVRGAPAARERVRYHLTPRDTSGNGLVELTAWRATDPEASPPRQTVRLIFKGDSVAVDEANRWNGVGTRIFESRRGAVPYLNLSTALLEEVTRRAARGPAACAEVPFFNLGGGQTATGQVCPTGGDSTTITLGSVEFRMRVDGEGRILGGLIPAQGLVIARQPGS